MVIKERLLTEKYSYIQNILTSGRTGLFAEECEQHCIYALKIHPGEWTFRYLAPIQTPKGKNIVEERRVRICSFSSYFFLWELWQVAEPPRTVQLPWGMQQSRGTDIC